MPPAPTARVNDYAGLLRDAERARLEQRLSEREAATGAQVVVAIFPSLEGESLEDFSIRLAERWRVGQKGLDNGVILLVFVAQRRVRLEVGYGLEPVITDAVADAIIREAVAPRFREGRFAAGLEAAAAAVYQRVGEGAGRPEGGRDGGRLPLMFLGLMGVVGLILLWEAMGVARRHRHYTLGPGGWSTPRRTWYGGGPWVGGPWGGGSRGGGGFSGGGGRFGGGGASGGW